jgi:FAD dependent oxidoreductase
LANTFKPPSTQRHYDVCVLGGGVGGAAAGAMLARRGFRVLIVDEGGRAPRADGGWLLPAVPSLQPQVRQLPAVEALLAEVGLVSDAARAQEALAPDLQLLLPRHRLDLCREPAALAAELRREWPADAARLAAGLQALLADADTAGHFLKAAPPLPPGGFFDGFALRKALRVTGAAELARRQPLAPLGDHPLAAALAALPGLLGHLDGPPAPLAAARICGVAVRGLARTAPGASTLEEALRKKVAETRGELLGGPGEPAKVEALGLDGGRLTTLRVAGSTDAFAARAFLLAAPLEWLAALVPGGVSPRAQKALARVRPGRRLAALHRVVRPAALPPGLGSAALVMLPGAPPDQAVLLEIQPARHDARKGAAAPADGARLVSAWTLAGDGEAGAAAAVARLGAALEVALPYLDRHLLHGSGPVLAPHLLVAADPAAGVAGLPVRSPWKNLLLCGREVVPGLGMEGELYAGLQAAAQAAALLGVRGKPR